MQTRTTGFLAAGSLAFALVAGEARADDYLTVDAAIVLAVDVSGSMDFEELQVQREGYLEALRHPELMRIVRAGTHGRIALAHFEWAGDVRRETFIPWTVVEDASPLAAFADAIEALPTRTSFGTSLSRAIDFAMTVIEAADFAADSWVIDISGDGPNNIGPPVTASRDRAVAAGVTINALPIVIRPSRGAAFLPEYFEACVIGGPGAFVMPATTPEEIAPAIRRKLFRELIGGEPEQVIRAQSMEPIDCLVGERLRRERGGTF